MHFFSFFINYINNLFELFYEIKPIIFKAFNHFIAFVSNKGKFSSNFEFTLFILFFQICFYFYFIAFSHLDVTNEAIWFISLLSFCILINNYLAVSSQNRDEFNFLETKVTMIEIQLRTNILHIEEVINRNRFVNLYICCNFYEDIWQTYLPFNMYLFNRATTSKVLEALNGLNEAFANQLFYISHLFNYSLNYQTYVCFEQSFNLVYSKKILLQNVRDL
jgi:hypothetical protein